MSLISHNFNLLFCVPYLKYFHFQRDLDIRSSLDALSAKMNGRVKNVTCVMQELGYLDDNLEPNYAKIKERIANLPVDEELRKDIQDGVVFCQQFSVSIKSGYLDGQSSTSSLFFSSNASLKSRSKSLHCHENSSAQCSSSNVTNTRNWKLVS